MKRMMKIFAAMTMATILSLTFAAFAEGEEEIETVETVAVEEEKTEEAMIVEELDIAETPVQFTGSVKVTMTCAEELYFGDTITLTANVTDANKAYTLRWEMNDGNGWQTVNGENDSVFAFEVNEQNAGSEIRVVLEVAE